MATTSQDPNIPYRDGISASVPVAANVQLPSGAMIGDKMAGGVINGKELPGPLYAVRSVVAVNNAEGKQGERGILARSLEICCWPHGGSITPALSGRRARIVGNPMVATDDRDAPAFGGH